MTAHKAREPDGWRALEIAAAGGHNLLLTGTPGQGQTALVLSLVGSLIHDLEDATEAPLRAPHHTVSMRGLCGRTGTNAGPGELVRANGGVLFLDDAPAFSQAALEAIRRVIDNSAVDITTEAGERSDATRFQLVASMRRCPCGECGAGGPNPRCSAQWRERYLRRIGQTIACHLHLVHHTHPSAPAAEPRPLVRAGIDAARAMQRDRWGASNQAVCAEILDDQARLGTGARAVLHAFRRTRFLLPEREEAVVRIGRTIADLSQSHEITPTHLAEAAGYRWPALELASE